MRVLESYSTTVIRLYVDVDDTPRLTQSSSIALGTLPVFRGVITCAQTDLKDRLRTVTFRGLGLTGFCDTSASLRVPFAFLHFHGTHFPCRSLPEEELRQLQTFGPNQKNIVAFGGGLTLREGVALAAKTIAASWPSAPTTASGSAAFSGAAAAWALSVATTPQPPTPASLGTSLLPAAAPLAGGGGAAAAATDCSVEPAAPLRSYLLRAYSALRPPLPPPPLYPPAFGGGGGGGTFSVSSLNHPPPLCENDRACE